MLTPIQETRLITALRLIAPAVVAGMKDLKVMTVAASMANPERSNCNRDMIMIIVNDELQAGAGSTGEITLAMAEAARHITFGDVDKHGFNAEVIHEIVSTLERTAA